MSNSNINSMLVVAGCYLSLSAGVLSVCRASQIASLEQDAGVVLLGSMIAAGSLCLSFKGLGEAFEKAENGVPMALRDWAQHGATVLMGAAGALIAMCAKGFEPLSWLSSVFG